MLRLICCILLFTPLSVYAQGTITIGGTGSGLEMMRQLGDLFAKQHRDVRFAVLPSLGSSGGIRAVQEGVLDVAIAVRPTRPEDKTLGSSLLCRTPLAFAVHPATPITAIRTTELIQLYSSTAYTWPDGGRARVVLRPETESDTQLLRHISPALDQALSQAKSRVGMILAVTDQDNLKALQTTPGGFGLISLAMYNAERADLRLLSFNGVAPTVKNLGQGKYPLVREYYLVSRMPADARVQEFIAFSRSARGMKLLKSLQCVPPEAH